ncbi:MAG TPA: SDR family oxidoreductase, partial [Anaerolinea sp.]|nr:SDR family oxidoreductase [Anaerolinea sp.]
MKDYNGKLVVITGGSSGIGLACAHAYARLGAHVVIIARDEKKLAEAVQAIASARQSNNQKIQAFPADVTDPTAMATCAQTVQQAVGVPDLLINSAGVARPGLFEEMEADLYRWMMDINFLGTVNATKAFLPGMIDRGSGHIVLISSVAGYLGTYGYTAYGASKFAIKGFGDALRQELQPKHIDVSVVFPPDTDTPQLAGEYPYKPPVLVAAEEGSQVMTADQVAHGILSGVDRKRYIITPGWMS